MMSDLKENEKNGKKSIFCNVKDEYKGLEKWIFLNMKFYDFV